jgi:sulfite reductase (NADPH) hemoprotein beta-component
MYRYTPVDHTIVAERVAQFRDQVARRLSGQLSEDDFRPQRLMNGLYLQRHAYMLRVAIPYGLLSTTQLRRLARIARVYDRGYGHFTTRQNIQYNWPKLEQVPDLLAELADVEMHAIQTSGNCVRNISADHLAGIAPDEIADPRPWCEILRQWSTFHPEFSYLPRKFKVAITGATNDRAAVIVHDIGFRLVRGPDGDIGFKVIVGGGLGRTPILGATIREFLPQHDFLSYSEAILRVYNLHGNRDNIYKARIKILVKHLGAEEFARQVEAEWEHIRNGPLRLTDAEIARVAAAFVAPPYRAEAAAGEAELNRHFVADREFATWFQYNTSPHRVAGYRIVHVPLKTPARPPGDMEADQMDALADIADRYSFGEVRTTHEQNLILGEVEVGDLYAVWQALKASDLALPNIGHITDLISCPGLDYCDLANAGSIGIAKRLTDTFSALDRAHHLGPLKVKISGCINACGHHHVGHIGILGISKAGEEYFQIMVGGSAADDASLGKWIGPAVAKDDVAPAVERMLDFYVAHRDGTEDFLAFTRRVGREAFKEVVYGAAV